MLHNNDTSSTFITVEFGREGIPREGLLDPTFLTQGNPLFRT